MAIWLIRAGSHGEYEQKFIQESRVYVTWDGLDIDLGKLKQRADLTAAMAERYTDTKPKAIMNWVSQIWPFAHEIKKGDLVVLPLKSQPAIYIGEVTGDYQTAPGGPNPYYHWRAVKWIGETVPRANFGKDLLYTFGAAMTICRVQRNNAEQRIAAATKAATPTPATDHAAGDTDLEELARDQIAQLISARFKGHGLTRLVEAILKAQGYGIACPSTQSLSGSGIEHNGEQLSALLRSVRAGAPDNPRYVGRSEGKRRDGRTVRAVLPA